MPNKLSADHKYKLRLLLDAVEQHLGNLKCEVFVFDRDAFINAKNKKMSDLNHFKGDIKDAIIEINFYGAQDPCGSNYLKGCLDISVRDDILMNPELGNLYVEVIRVGIASCKTLLGHDITADVFKNAMLRLWMVAELFVRVYSVLFCTRQALGRGELDRTQVVDNSIKKIKTSLVHRLLNAGYYADMKTFTAAFAHVLGRVFLTIHDPTTLKQIIDKSKNIFLDTCKRILGVSQISKDYVFLDITRENIDPLNASINLHFSTQYNDLLLLSARYLGLEERRMHLLSSLGHLLDIQNHVVEYDTHFLKQLLQDADYEKHKEKLSSLINNNACLTKDYNRLIRDNRTLRRKISSGSAAQQSFQARDMPPVSVPHPAHSMPAAPAVGFVRGVRAMPPLNPAGLVPLMPVLHPAHSMPAASAMCFMPPGFFSPPVYRKPDVSPHPASLRGVPPMPPLHPAGLVPLMSLPHPILMPPQGLLPNAAFLRCLGSFGCQRRLAPLISAGRPFGYAAAAAGRSQMRQ